MVKYDVRRIRRWNSVMYDGSCKSFFPGGKAPKSEILLLRVNFSKTVCNYLLVDFLSTPSSLFIFSHCLRALFASFHLCISPSLSLSPLFSQPAACLWVRHRLVYLLLFCFPIVALCDLFTIIVSACIPYTSGFLDSSCLFLYFFRLYLFRFRFPHQMLHFPPFGMWRLKLISRHSRWVELFFYKLILHTVKWWNLACILLVYNRTDGNLFKHSLLFHLLGYF